MWALCDACGGCGVCGVRDGGADFNRRAPIFGGILQQVDQHPLHQGGIKFNQRQLCGYIAFHGLGAQRMSGCANRRAYHFLYRLPVGAQVDLSVLKTRHVQQIDDQRVELPRLPNNRAGNAGMRSISWLQRELQRF